MEFRNLYEKRLQQQHTATSLAIPNMPDMWQKIFLAGLQSLNRASLHLSGKFYSKIMFNIEVLVFCLWWFGAVNISTNSVSDG